MLRAIILPILCAAIILRLPAAVSAQKEIPRDTLENLQETFGMLRDRLWEVNDERFWHYGEYERCIAMMRLIVQIDPREVQAYDTGAWLMQNQLRDDDAKAFLIEGLRNNPDTWDMFFALGWFHYTHTCFDEALIYLESATLRDCPAYVWRLLAHTHEQMGRVSDALNIWLQIEALFPDDPIPERQIERIFRGEPPSPIPSLLNKWREQRRQAEQH